MEFFRVIFYFKFFMSRFNVFSLEMGIFVYDIYLFLENVTGHVFLENSGERSGGRHSHDSRSQNRVSPPPETSQLRPPQRPLRSSPRKDQPRQDLLPQIAVT